MLVSSVAFTACGPELTSLHALAQVGEVQSGAPLHVREEIIVHAPAHRVWQCLANVAAWPTWNAAVRSSEPPPSVTGEAIFGWDNHGSDIRAQLGLVRPDSVLAWSDAVSTAKAVHVWRLSEVSPHETRVDVEETMDGFLVPVFYTPHELTQTLATWLSSLRAVAESADRALLVQALAQGDSTLSVAEKLAIFACR